MENTYETLIGILEGIRDERVLYSNTATRIGSALLTLLSYLEDNIDDKVDKTSIVEQTGNSSSLVMSQKFVSQLIAALNAAIPSEIVVSSTLTMTASSSGITVSYTGHTSSGTEVSRSFTIPVLTDSLAGIMTPAKMAAITTAINNEATARQNADYTLQENIDSEASLRQQGDYALQGNLSNEATARQNADNALQASINAAKTALKPYVILLDDSHTLDISELDGVTSTENDREMLKGAVAAAIQQKPVFYSTKDANEEDCELMPVAIRGEEDEYIYFYLTASDGVVYEVYLDLTTPDAFEVRNCLAPKDNTIAHSHLKSNAVGTSNIIDESVTRPKLDPNLVTDLKSEMADPSADIWVTLVPETAAEPTSQNFQNNAEYSPYAISIKKGDKITVSCPLHTDLPVVIFRNNNGVADSWVARDDSGMSYVAPNDMSVFIGVWDNTSTIDGYTLNYSVKRTVADYIQGLDERLERAEQSSSETGIVTLASPSTLTALANKYYKITQPVETLTITLPYDGTTTKVKGLVVSLTTGTLANGSGITIACSNASIDVVYFDGFEWADDTTYELNFIYNGSKWIVAYGIVNDSNNEEESN